jgi:hypothetical protein
LSALTQTHKLRATGQHIQVILVTPSTTK